MLDIVKIDLPNCSNKITVNHLLTHTSGCPDYCDEEICENIETLWETVPLHKMLKPIDFLKLSIDEKMKFEPGERFHYSNGGFILLGLIIEEISGLEYAQYVEKNILKPMNMNRSGFFKTDRLPEDCATAYIIEEDGTWRSNLFSTSPIGCADSGMYSCASDLVKMWQNLLGNKILTKQLTSKMLRIQETVPSAGENIHYGLGVWIYQEETGESIYSIIGHDPGIAFISKCNPSQDLFISLLGNSEVPLWGISKEIDDFFG